MRQPRPSLVRRPSVEHRTSLEHRPSPARRRVRVLTALAAAAALAVAGAQPAAAAAPGYVALGDSFAAGVGARSYDADSGDCYRSPKGYPALVAARSGLALTFAACSGAVTADVIERQASALSRSTRYVTLTVGGNDLGFASVLTTCALPGWLGDCTAAVERGRRTLRTRLPARLDAVLATVAARSPRARVVVTGYPRLFAGDDCNAATFFSRAEMTRLNAATDELDALIGARTRAAGFRYVSPVPRFTGHAWCEDEAWVNGLSHPALNAFHPNATGHAAYADLVGPALLGASAGTARADGAAPAVRLPDTAGTRTGYPVGTPDLGTAAVARASARAGVTRAELAQLRRAQASGASNRELDRLDAQITRRAAARQDG